ncbi:hypothetical protein ABZ532_28725 [Streptomyces sp. NPDC019396]|uniref:hypothetical protein n=1 Tax=Streptomyces sp. NPDC019396 TaxID=3154687 RepID=UPI0033F6FD59
MQLAATELGELRGLDDLNELTVQLDGLGRQLTERNRLMGSADTERPDAPSAQDSSDGPVFVDASGRRSRKLRRIGWVLAIACACYAITLVAALIGGNSRAPWLLIPGPEGEQNTGTVQEQPVPTGSPTDPAAPGSSPGAPALDGSTGAAPVQQPDGTGAGGSAGASASADPGATTGPSDTVPGKGGATAGTGKPVTRPTVSAPVDGGAGGEEPEPEEPPAPPTDTETAPTEEPPTDPPAGDGGQQGLEGAQ